MFITYYWFSSHTLRAILSTLSYEAQGQTSTYTSSKACVRWKGLTSLRMLCNNAFWATSMRRQRIGTRYVQAHHQVFHEVQRAILARCRRLTTKHQIVTQHEPYELTCEDTNLNLKQFDELVFIQTFQQGRSAEMKQVFYVSSPKAWKLSAILRAVT